MTSFLKQKCAEIFKLLFYYDSLINTYCTDVDHFSHMYYAGAAR